jgi:prephenate dehydrogenase
MKVAIIGLGLIGGSFAIALKEKGLANHIFGVEKNESISEEAMKLNLVNEILSMEEAIEKSDLIVLATPVDVMMKLLPSIMNTIDQQVVIDLGSTKRPMVDVIKDHPKRQQFVACHPMAGTEFSGPSAAIPDLYKNKRCVICNKEESDSAALALVEKVMEKIEMKLLYMSAEQHDIHTAYISHISHISSFALALTVLEKEEDVDKIFELASGGFSSTVRLAKSSPDTWTPIFKQNRDNLLDVVDEHINALSQFRSYLIKNNFDGIYTMIEEANKIKKILK